MVRVPSPGIVLARSVVHVLYNCLVCCLVSNQTSHGRRDVCGTRKKEKHRCESACLYQDVKFHLDGCNGWSNGQSTSGCPCSIQWENRKRNSCFSPLSTRVRNVYMSFHFQPIAPRMPPFRLLSVNGHNTTAPPPNHMVRWLMRK